MCGASGDSLRASWPWSSLHCDPQWRQPAVSCPFLNPNSVEEKFCRALWQQWSQDWDWPDRDHWGHGGICQWAVCDPGAVTRVNNNSCGAGVCHRVSTSPDLSGLSRKLCNTGDLKYKLIETHTCKTSSPADHPSDHLSLSLADTMSSSVLTGKCDQ